MRSDQVWKPGDKEWLKQRKAEWKVVYDCLKINGFYTARQIKRVKEYFFSGDEDILTQPYEHTTIEGLSRFRPLCLVVQLWLHPDTSQERWDLIWRHLTVDYQEKEDEPMYASFAYDSEHFFIVAGRTGVECHPPQGTFNGMEERLTQFFVRSDRYTDDTMRIEWNPKARLCPWPTAQDLFGAFVVEMRYFLTEPFEDDSPRKNINIHNPYQYLIGHWFSCFDYDVDLHLDEEGTVKARKVFFRAIIETSQADESTKHPNRLRFARNMRQALDERWTPDPFKALWEQVKKEMGVA